MPESKQCIWTIKQGKLTRLLSAGCNGEHHEMNNIYYKHCPHCGASIKFDVLGIKPMGTANEIK